MSATQPEPDRIKLPEVNLLPRSGWLLGLRRLDGRSATERALAALAATLWTAAGVGIAVLLGWHPPLVPVP
jgi:hypothetical protein